MRTLRIIHTTRYAYDRPVVFGLHRLMIRPRDGHDLRILSSSLTVFPRAEVRWVFDTFGNSVALLSFQEMADELEIISELELRRYELDGLDGIARFSAAYPFRYDSDERFDLAPLLAASCPDERPAIRRWLAKTLRERPEGSLEVLNLLGSAIHEAFRYRRREEEGVQSPGQTLAIGSGSCRDFAFFFMEAARCLGFAARFVTGYLYDPGVDGAEDLAVVGSGATHAWADAFVPGAGWIEFDPTNQIVAGRNLVRVATTRAPGQAQPVRGSFRHDGATFLGLDVKVSVNRLS